MGVLSVLVSRLCSQRSMVAPEISWRLIHDVPRSGPRNMALDHALAVCLPRNEGVLRLYSWKRPTVSFGRNEPAVGRYSEQVVCSTNFEYVRRPTGGRAVLHDKELTYSIVIPLRETVRPREIYEEINRTLAKALISLNAPVTLSKDRQCQPLSSGPCFQSPAAGEVTANGRKLVGSAQARIGGRLLQHGSILLDGDQSQLDGLFGDTSSRPTSVTLRELVGATSPDFVARAVAVNLKSHLGGKWASVGYTHEEIETAGRLENERYNKTSWTWRK